MCEREGERERILSRDADIARPSAHVIGYDRLRRERERAREMAGGIKRERGRSPKLPALEIPELERFVARR